MPKAYMVFSYHSITDPQKFAAYAKLAPAAVAPFGSRVLARGTAAGSLRAGNEGVRFDCRISEP